MGGYVEVEASPNIFSFQSNYARPFTAVYFKLTFVISKFVLFIQKFIIILFISKDFQVF